MARDFGRTNIQQLAGSPGSPNEGDTYYDTTLHQAFVWNGTVWVPWVGSGSVPEYGTTYLAANTNSTSTAWVTLLSFTLPSAGTWDITYFARGQWATLANAYGTVAIFDGTGTLVPNSEVLADYIAPSSGTAIGGSTGAARIIVTTTGPATYTLQAKSGSGYTITWTSDTSGRTGVTWSRLVAIGPPGVGFDGITSATSLALDFTSHTATLSPSVGAFSAGSRIRFTSRGTPNTWIEAPIASVAGNTVTFTPDLYLGTGGASYSDWNVSLTGQRGASPVQVTGNVTQVTAASAAISTTETTLITSGSINGNGSARVKVSIAIPGFTFSVGTDKFAWAIKANGTAIASGYLYQAQSVTNQANPLFYVVTHVPNGATTYTVTLVRSTGTGTATSNAAATSPMTLIVEQAW
jgi:hypothetical protein